MIRIIEGYEPKNKRLSRLGRKARLQIVLNGIISRQMLAEIKKAVDCVNCKHYSNEGWVMSKPISACRKVGQKSRKDMTMVESMAKDGRSHVKVHLPYCAGFEEKKD